MEEELQIESILTFNEGAGPVRPHPSLTLATGKLIEWARKGHCGS